MKRLFAALVALCVATPALADSCWDHNGSLMRLTASGNARTFLYEAPRQGIRNVGVTPGTWLFSGRKSGDWYSGVARVFSRSCAALEYHVEGPVLQNPLRVEVRGSREIYRNCSPTGQWTQDVLVFTYRYNC